MHMEAFKTLINFCISILQISINLFGYHVSLFNVLVWGLAIYFVLRLVFGIFK